MSFYEERLSEALNAWVTELPRLSPRIVGFVPASTPLLHAIESYNASDEYHVGGEAMSLRVWRAVLEQHVAGHDIDNMKYHLILGLLTNDRWRELARDSYPREFVGLAVDYVSSKTGQFARVVKEYDYKLRLKLIEAVTQWIAPAADLWGAAPRAIAAALFGEAWCAMVYDSCSRGESLSVLLTATKPEFLPGRLDASAEQPADPLPDMTC